MSLLAATGKVATGAVAATAGVQLAAQEVAHPSIWGVTMLAIPLGVLVASMAGSAARAYREEAQSDRSIPRKVANVVIDGFIGGWLATFLVTFIYTREYFDGVAPAIVGAFGGLLVQFIRDNGPRWIEQAWQAILSFFSKKRPEGAP